MGRNHYTVEKLIMEKIVLYCKSYRNDVDRAKVLLDSINQYNVEKLPFFISVPKNDMAIFQKFLGTKDYTLIPDEDIDPMTSGWVGQQVVKSQFWKLGLCENYLCLDSDSQFIRNFGKNDFMYTEDVPYTVCHEYKEFFEFMDKYPMPFDPHIDFYNERKAVMDIFGRTGVIYDFAPSPLIWSTKVWSSLVENYLKPNKLTISDAYSVIHSEFTWYGEWLLVNNIIPIYPREPIFKSYHYRHQYEMDKQQGVTVERLAKYYLGYIINTNWGAPLKF